jgi:MYXO-CTERM domain-containing protein
VNFDDFTILAANFGLSLPSDAARASVPEPGFAAALLMAGFLGRRRRCD